MSTASSRDKQHAGFLIGALTHSGAKREGGRTPREGWRNSECHFFLTDKGMQLTSESVVCQLYSGKRKIDQQGREARNVKANV